MRKLYLTLATMLLGASGTIMAETYGDPTTPVPDGASWTNAGTSPGVYSELKGNYELNLTGVYASIGMTNQLLIDKIGWVVNDQDEIVYTGTCTPVAMGMRNMNHFSLAIPEANKITEPGTYWLIFPTGTSKSTANQARDLTTGQWNEIYNLKAGPYIIGEIGDAVDADITVSPQGEYQVTADNNAVVITVANADIFNIGFIDEIISVKGPGGAEITMEPGTKSDNTLRWEFPYDGSSGQTALLAKGDYTVTVDFSTFSAYTSDLNPLSFPAEPQTYSFTVGGGDIHVTPAFTLNPDPANPIETWTAGGIIVNLTDYQCQTIPARGTLELNVITPDKRTLTLTNSRTSKIQLGFTTSADDFQAQGIYKFYLKFNNLKGVSRTNADLEVVFDDISFEYRVGTVLPDPVNAIYTLSPEGELDTAPEAVTFTVSNAETLALIPDGNPISVTDEAGNPVAMQTGVIDGNTITWGFPSSPALPEGNYTITLDFTAISGTAADDAELLFPESPETLTFEYFLPRVVPTATLTPDPDTTTEWTKSFIAFDFTDYVFVTAPKAGTIELVIETPDNRTITAKNNSRTNPRQMQVPLSAADFQYPGTYRGTLKLAGQEGVSKTDATRLVIFEDLTFEYHLINIPDVPTVTVDGAAPEEGDIEFPHGESVNVELSLSDAPAEVEVYYRWTEGSATPAEFEKYTNAITISTSGTLEYYSKYGECVSETQTLTFVKGIDPSDNIPEGVTVTPLPGTYKSIKGIKLEFDNGFADSFNGWDIDLFDAKGSLTGPDDMLLEIAPALNPLGEVFYNGFNLNTNGAYRFILILKDQKYINENAETATAPETVIVLNYTIDVLAGIGTIDADSDNEAVYYDLNGLQVHGNLAPGIYIRIKDGKADKIVVR